MNPGSKSHDRGKQAVLEDDPSSPLRVSLKPRFAMEVPVRRSVADPEGRKEQNSARGLLPNYHQSNNTNIPLPKNLKVDIPVFNGEGDVLNWLYQLEHVFAIHKTPVGSRIGFCVFFLQEIAMLWWR